MPSDLANATSRFVHDWLLPGLSVAIGGTLLGVALGAALMHSWRVRRERALAQARNARGKRGEARAAALLEAAGYDIVARQRRASYSLSSDGGELRVRLSFDFVVAKDGREWVAEVKTGALGTQLTHADTRRQLLEYQLASGQTQVLLVDPERERISLVSFPLGETQMPAAARVPRDWTLRACLFLAAALALSLYLLSR